MPLSRAGGDGPGEVTILFNIPFVELDRNNLQLAQTRIEEALKIVESLRTKVISQELRTSYFASQQDAYEFYIDLLMELHKQDSSKGYDAKALEASERARARSLLELLTEARADIRSGVNPKLLEQERTLEQQLNAAQENRVKLLTNEQLEANKQQIESFLTQLEQVKGQIRATSPGYAKLNYPQPLTLLEIQQVLDDNTLLLQYSLGEEHSYLWAVTKTGMTSYTLPGQAELEQAANKFYSAISKPGSPNDVKEPGQRLSQLIKLDEIMPRLQGKKLLIAADGALHRVPFAAIPNPKSPANYQPLLLEHEIINLPSISAIATLRQTLNRSPAPKTLAVVADPVFSKTDDRVTGKERPNPCANVPFLTASDTNRSPESDIALQLQNSLLERSIRDMKIENIERLPNTRREAERILATIPNNQRTAVCDFEANRNWVTQQGTLDQYRYLLFATHGLINTDEPEESSLVLSLVDQSGESRNGLLRLGDIFNLNLNAELAILSACQTGRGEEVRGEGLIGLTRGFMYAGAKRVLVSLWNVNDSKTADLMEFFSRQVMQDNRAPATALQAAQKQMWQTQQGTEYQHPYYWAAFTLQGEWRK